MYNVTKQKTSKHLSKEDCIGRMLNCYVMKMQCAFFSSIIIHLNTIHSLGHVCSKFKSALQICYTSGI